MKTKKIEYYIRSTKKDILNRDEKYVHFYALNTWLGLLLHELLHQCGVAWRHCSGVMEDQVDSGLQVICIVGSGVSHLDSLWGSGLVSLLANQAQ